MITLIKSIFGIGTTIDYQTLLKNGAQIIDVRSREEYQGGHIQGSINMPLQTLQNNFTKIKKNKPVITCCASGIRSASAKSMLKSNGFNEVHNGGGWMGLNRKINNA